MLSLYIILSIGGEFYIPMLYREFHENGKKDKIGEYPRYLGDNKFIFNSRSFALISFKPLNLIFAKQIHETYAKKNCHVGGAGGRR